MSDDEDFEAGPLSEVFLPYVEQSPFSVRKYLSNPKELMEKILFTSFKVEPFFPIPFITIPDFIKPETAQRDTNNMNLIEESAFGHEKMKKEVLGILFNNETTTQKHILKMALPTMAEYYAEKTPIYQKYKPNPKAKCMATYLIDSKAILQQEFKKNLEIFSHNSNRIQPSIPTQRTKIEFSSNFESGNLFQVYQLEYNEFDLILQNDINTKGNNQWFFFMVKNVPKGVTLKFNIVNMSKKHSLFGQGMKPYVFSMSRYEKRKVGWVREGMKVNYDENERFCKEYNERSNRVLSFEYRFTYDGDVVYFSHSLPYRVSDLARFLSAHIKEPSNSKLIKLKDLNRTLGNQELDIIELSDESSRENKKIVWIIARQHPGEVTSSFMMEGIINFLLGKSPKAMDLLKKYVFKIVPMVNTDGVVHGNSRAELNGVDPNRRWTNPHKMRNPVIWSLKKHIEKDGKKVEMFLDLHSHSRKMGTFFYGNSLNESKLETRRFPWIVCKNDERFSYADCRFSQCNYHSARHVIFESLKIPLVYTVESSFYGYKKNDYKIVEYFPKDYAEMGAHLMTTFHDYSFTKPATNSMRINLEEMRFIDEVENDDEDAKSLVSESDAGDEEFEEKDLQALLPNFYGAKKNKKKKIVAKPKKETVKKEIIEREEQTPPPRIKKNDKESHYRLYFSGRKEVATERKKIVVNETVVETQENGVQVSISDNLVLKGSVNISIGSLAAQRRASLCILGQKVEEEFSVFGNCVGIQADMSKIFSTSKDESKKNAPRKSFKLTSKPNNFLQVKENNFLNRADCHTLPLRGYSKR